MGENNALKYALVIFHPSVALRPLAKSVPHGRICPTVPDRQSNSVNLKTSEMNAVLIDPLNLWSLWVPFVLLLLILGAAIYFVRASIR